MTPEYVLRSPTDDDLGFIFSAWAKGAHECIPWCYVPTERWSPKQREHMERCMASGTTYVLCHPDDSTELMGFVCFDRLGDVLVVHWLYVKDFLRKKGLASAVIEDIAPSRGDSPIILTQWSRHAAWARAKWPLRFDPYLPGMGKSTVWG